MFNLLTQSSQLTPELLGQVILAFTGLLFAITIHEFAHSFVADKLGDPTPRIKDRLTLDPRAHLDPLGVIMLLLTNFGWGKPAPVDPYNLKQPVRDMALIAAAGAGSNFLFAATIALIIYLIPALPAWVLAGLIQIFATNIYLALFNLLPVGPLDGTKIATALLPKKEGLEYEQFMQRNGILLLMLTILPLINGRSLASILISPAFSFIFNLFF